MSAPRPRSVPILMYHEVATAARQGFARFTVLERDFEWQMRWLARAGFTSIGMDQLVAARLGRSMLPRRPVVITFDDGFAECGRLAPPILRRNGFTAIFYLVAGLIGQPGEWLEREVGFSLPLMDWSTVIALDAGGFELGSHTISHARLARIPNADACVELERSREILERGVGRPVKHLAYPFSSHNARVMQLARDMGYVTACTTVEARSCDEDMLALRRIPVYGTESRLDFVSRLLTARSFADVASGALGALKRRVMGHVS